LGLDTLWNEHCNAAGDDYVALRRRFGKNLRLIGGIDSRALYQDRRAVDDAIERVVPPLLEDGGYLPSVDDRVRSNVPFENYRYYRERLAALVGGG
jgi:uroporphyrinogen decarboxylase